MVSMNDLDNKNQPPPKPEKDSSKDRIINAALEDFSKYGMAGARVDRIAQKAGINKAMIYYHFTSKENLYIESLKYFFRRFTEKIRSSIVKGVSPEETLGNIADTYAELFMRNKVIRPIILRELANPTPETLEQLADLFIESNIPYEVGEIFKDGIDKGILRRVDMRQAIISFLAMNIGYFFAYPIMNKVFKIDNQEQFIDERKKAITDLFFNGMKAR